MESVLSEPVIHHKKNNLLKSSLALNSQEEVVCLVEREAAGWLEGWAYCWNYRVSLLELCQLVLGLNRSPFCRWCPRMPLLSWPVGRAFAELWVSLCQLSLIPFHQRLILVGHSRLARVSELGLYVGGCWRLECWPMRTLTESHSSHCCGKWCKFYCPASSCKVCICCPWPFLPPSLTDSCFKREKW